MDDPSPNATWHPALRPEKLNEADLYSPKLDRPRGVSLSEDEVTTRAPVRSRAPTNSVPNSEPVATPVGKSESDLLQAAGDPSGSHSAALMKMAQTKPAIAEKETSEGSRDYHSHGNPSNVKVEALKMATIHPADESTISTHSEKEEASKDIVTNQPSQEPRSPLELFPASGQDSSRKEIDAAWGNIESADCTNIFPTIPAPRLTQISTLSLPHSQVASILGEEQTRIPDISQNEVKTSYPWNDTRDVSAQDDNFFSNPQSRVQPPLTPPDDEARYEEGIPLISQDNGRQADDVLNIDQDLLFGKDPIPVEDDFFSDLTAPRISSQHQPRTLMRKTTEQVLNSMHVSQGSVPLTEDAETFAHQSSTLTDSPVVQDGVTEPISNSVASAQTNDNLAAKWYEVLGDDLLDDAVDPSSFFGEEDDGFLFEEETTIPLQPQPATHQTDLYQNPAQNYTNPNAASYVPAGFDSATYQRRQSPFQTQPVQPTIITRAQSFADKSKGGYESPYDAPMDMFRSRRAPASRTSKILPQVDSAPPPPPRSDSIQSGYGGGPTVPQLSPSASSHSSSSNNYQPVSSSPQGLQQQQQQQQPLQRPSPSGFFEELPVTTKSRSSASTARFTPQSFQNQFAPPPSSSPQQHVTHQPPPRVSSQSSSPLPNQFGLVGPAKVLPFSPRTESAPIPNTTPTAPSTVTGRYSPSIPHRPDQQQPPQDSRIIPPNPYANPMGIKRPPSVPHQHIPNRSSPLARSSSANQYQFGDETDSRQGLGPRRPSMLRNAQNLAETQSPNSQALPNPLGITSGSFSSESSQNTSTYKRDARSSHEFSRQSSQLAAHQEVQTPRTAIIQPQASLRTHAKDVETYSISQQTISSSTPRGRAPSLAGHDNFMPPSDVTAQDPLERWRGAPIFRFGFGGTVVASFPGRIPRYTQASRIPSIKSSPGEVRIVSAKIFPSNDRFASFPGPLKAKGKKKDVLLWLHNGVTSLAQGQQELYEQGATDADQKRHQEKIMLWKVLATLVEYDGNVDGNAQALNAIRTILSPEAGPYESQESLTQSFLPPISSPDTAFRPQAPGGSSVDAIRQHLLNGEREKAVWYAVDQKLWGHALLIASTMQRDLWKQIIHEFVRTEVKPAGRNTESLAALYDIFAGNWEESVDELVPPSARAGLTLMNKNSTGGMTGGGLDGLNRWRETLNLILSNRTVDDSKAIIAMGQLLASYGRFEAAHICYIFAKAPGMFGGFDDPQAAIVLLGADHRQLPLDYARDPDSILLTEVYEFIQCVLTPTSTQSSTLPHLQAFKLHHAELLVDLGLRDQAQQYCDTIISTLKATTNRSPYFHPRLFTAAEELGARLRQSGKDGNSSWISRPNVDKMSGSFFKALSGFIAGDENDASVASAKADTSGPFARINGTTPEMISRNPSPALGSYGDVAAGQMYAIPDPSIPPMTNSRYAPGSTTTATYAPMATALPPYSAPSISGYHNNTGLPANPYGMHQPQQNVHVPFQATQALSPLSNVTKYSPDLALQPQAFHPPQNERVEASRFYSDSDAESPPRGKNNEAPAVNGFLSAEVRSNSYQPTAAAAAKPRYSRSSSYAPRSRSLEPSAASYEAMSTTSQPRSYAPSPNLDPITPYDADSYQPSAPMYGEFPAEEPNSPYGTDETASTNIPSIAQEMNYNANNMTNQTLDNTTPVTGLDRAPYSESEPAAGYQPPSYGYEPPSYDAEATEEPEVKSPRKKKSFMDLDDDDDDLARRTNALKKSRKSTKDKDTDDAFRRAAEEDAKKGDASKSGSGWFGGIWGRSAPKDPNQAKPKAHQIHIGEENSFVFDKDLNKWVNKKAGGESAAASTIKAPPPKGPPKSLTPGPPVGIKSPIFDSVTKASSESLNETAPVAMSSLPPFGPSAGLTAGLAPPSRPGTGMSVVSNTSSVDDLMGLAQPRKAGTVKRTKKRAGYVDVLAEKT